MPSLFVSQRSKAFARASGVTPLAAGFIRLGFSVTDAW